MTDAAHAAGDGTTPFADTDVAIVAMSGRFPGARDVDALWERVRRGDDCLTDLGRDELLGRGVPQDVVDDPTYVRRTGALDGVEDFDPGFFGIGARDAAIMDPQHRHFLECAWEALEAAAVDPARFAGAIGVFAGCGMDTYLLHCLLADPRLVDELGWFLLRHTGNDKDFLSTLVSYRLDLRGPSVNVQTACSTSLVAVHLAIQSLLGFECDLALAGGVTIEVPVGVGYRYHEGEILSPDGRCRAFDAASNGTVLTSGVGVVALRRAADAWTDGDPILAVIKGSAVNNDGGRKVSFLAPSVDGHADVVTEALAVAGLGPADIQLVETHGTGTALGDPIEFAALSAAFGAGAGPGTCRLTSTKPNIGHLDTAAGVASLIKVVQAMRHAVLPPLANHTAPNDLLDLEGSPFVVSGEAAPWPGDHVRRAGISSLGVGGTNAHVVVEEAPPRPGGPAQDRAEVLLLSARDEEALPDVAARLADHLERNPDLALADVARTLAHGRRAFPVRRAVAAPDLAGAILRLRKASRPMAWRAEEGEAPPRTILLFPGGGSQYAGMGADLDERFAVFHATRDQVLDEVARHTDVDVRAGLAADVDPAHLDDPAVALPLVFATSLAMARQWMALGVEPDAMVGHSLGEYVAAHLAGVMSLPDVVRLVVARARLMAQVGGEGAAMLVVPLPEADVVPLLGPRVSLAVVNAEAECVVAGDRSEVLALAERLEADGTTTSLVPLAAAAHSVLLDPVLDEFRAIVRSVELSAPTRPFVSNLTGKWITADEATDPEHWVRHLRGTVRFADGLATALADGPAVTIELGPGHSLSATARRAPTPPLVAVASLRHPRQDVDGTAHALEALAQRWVLGQPVDLDALVGDGPRTTLPTYPFRRHRHWIDPPDPGATPLRPGGGTAVGAAAPPDRPRRIHETSEMWWETRWVDRPSGAAGPARRWFVVAGDGPERTALCDALGRTAESVVSLTGAAELSGHQLTDGDAVAVLGALDDTFDDGVARWLGDAAETVRLLGSSGTSDHRVALVTRGAADVDGPAARPAGALALGIARVAATEYPDLDSVAVDVVDVLDEAAADRLAAELASTPAPGRRAVALRDGRRLELALEATTPGPATTEHLGFRPGGTYLVTGGLGGIGHALTTHLARAGATLCVATSSALPPPDQRDRWRREHGPMDRTSRRLERLAALEATGATVEVVVADLADPAAIEAVLDEAVARVGPLDGVVHAAGVLHDELIATSHPDTVEAVVGAKARGATVLVESLARRDVPLLLLVSSTSTVLAPAGQAAYVAANSVLDALAGQHGSLKVVTFVSGMWAGTGMADEFERRARLGLGPGEPVAHPVFEEVVRSEREPHVVDVVGHLDASRHWLVADHRIGGNPVLPGTGHLELLVGAVRLVHPERSPVELAAVALHQPLVVRDGALVALRVRVIDDGARCRLQLESAPTGDRWEVHSTAELVATDGTPDEPIALASIADAARDAEAIDAFAGQRDHMVLGPRWSVEARARIDVAGASGRLEAPAHDDDAAWCAGPALVDAATGLAAQLSREDGDDGLRVPIGYRRVTWFGPVPAVVDVRVAEVPAAGSGPATFDVEMTTADGVPVLRLFGLELWRLAPDRDLGAADEGSDALASDAEPALVDLAVAEGITPEEGVALVEQLLADGRPRLVASSVDLDALVRRRDDATRVVEDRSTDGAAGGGADDDAPVADRIAAMWADLLGVTPGPDDDFFELGGHSLLAIRLVARIARAFGVQLALTDLFETPTLAGLAAFVEAHAAAPERDRRSPVVPISTEGTGTPLFIVHGAGGSVVFLWSLARALAEDRPVYGIQAVGIDGRDEPDTTIDQMADRYVAALRDAHPGPYLLGGYSGGGLVALEMAERLRAAGEDVPRVVLFDSVPAGCASPRRRQRVLNVARHVAAGRVRGVWPYLSVLARNGFRRPPVVDPDLDGTHVNLFDHFSAVAEAHGTGTYGADVTLLKADQVWPIQPHDYYWTGHLTGRFDVVSVPGDHFSMFSPELVPTLARAVRAALRGL